MSKYVYYHVEVVRVVDGDTVRLFIDMGNHIGWEENFRLAGINAPEPSQLGGAEATAQLTLMVANGIHRVQTYKPTKYGNWSTDVWVAVTGGELLVNAHMIRNGFAVPYFGGKRL